MGTALRRGASCFSYSRTCPVQQRGCKGKQAGLREAAARASHNLQALGNPAAFGRYQLKMQSKVRLFALEAQTKSRAMTTFGLMRSIVLATSEALTIEAS